jgi:SAM-dependent methyltransferase
VADPWDHPDWYDLHDTTWTAGPEREPEHYRELVLALPPLDARDHLIDVGAGTGKLSGLIARGYPKLGRVTLVEPNRDKLDRAQRRLRDILPEAEIHHVLAGVGEGAPLPRGIATVAVVGSVLMPVMELRGGSLRDGLAWLRASVQELRAMVGPGGWLFDLETLAAPWARGSGDDPVRRLTMAELTGEFVRAGFSGVECVYRFRDRVIVKGQQAPG